MKHLHVHVRVSDFEKSKTFYSTLFGQDPSVVKEAYAKWMLDDPRVNFVITPGEETGVGHLGFQSDTEAGLAEIATRLKAADLETFDEENTTCCYARSDKAWVTDPDGVIWENFKTHELTETFGVGPDVETLMSKEQGVGGCVGSGCC